MLYRQTGSLPFRISVFKPKGFESPVAQFSHGLIRQNAVLATAASDDFLVAR